MRRALICILAFGVFGIQSAFAEQVIFNKTGQVDYNVSVEEAKEENVVLFLTNDGQAFDDSEWEAENTLQIIFFDDGTVDNEGNVKFKILLDTPGKYMAEVSYGGGKITDNITYINSAGFESAVKELNDNKNDAEAVAEILKRLRAELGLWINLYDTSDMSEVAKIVSDKLTEADLSTTDYEKTISVLEGCFVIEGLNSGKITSLGEYRKYFELDSEVIENFWLDEHSDEIANRVSYKGYTKVEDMIDDLNEAVALVKIYHASGFGEVKEVVKYFRDEIGISIANDSAARKIQNKDYESFEDLAAAIKKANNDSVSSSSSGSGGGSSNSNKKPNIPVVYNENSDKTNKVVAASRFSDLDSVPWAKDSIEKLALLGVINGKTENLFYPHDKITREEFVTLIVRAFHINVVGDALGFYDVNKSDWFYDYVLKAYNCGIITGISPTEFGSGMNITRQDSACVVYNTLKLCQVDLGEIYNTTEFADDDEVSGYAKCAVEVLRRNSIMIGNNNSFNPKAFMTRAEAAKVIEAIIKYSEEGSGI